MLDPDTPDAADVELGHVRPAAATRVGGSARTTFGGSLGLPSPRWRFPLVRLVAVVGLLVLTALALVRPVAAPLPITDDPFARPVAVAWSPDGALIAYVVLSREPLLPAASAEPPPAAHLEVWVAPVDGSAGRRTAILEADRGYPDPAIQWAPDSRHLGVLQAGRLTVLPAAGGAAVAINRPADEFLEGYSWAPDGARLAYAHGGPASSTISIANLGGPTTDLPLYGVPSDPAWSVDGRLIAYGRRDELARTFVVSPDGTGARAVGQCCPVGWALRGLLVDDGSLVRLIDVSTPDGTELSSDSSGWQPLGTGWVGIRVGEVLTEGAGGGRPLTSKEDVTAVGALSVSPSGRYVTFLGRQGSVAGLFGVSTGGGPVSLLLRGSDGVVSWAPDRATPELAVIDGRSILAIDPDTGATRTLVPRERIAGPELAGADEAIGRLAIGPDGPTSDIVRVRGDAASALLIENTSRITWAARPLWSDRTSCTVVAATSVPFVGQAEQPCLALPGTTVSLSPGPPNVASLLRVYPVDLGETGALDVLLEPAP